MNNSHPHSATYPHQAVTSTILERTTYYGHEMLSGYYSFLYGIWKLEKQWGSKSIIRKGLPYSHLEILKFGIYGKVDQLNVVECGMLSVIDKQEGSLILGFISDNEKAPFTNRVYNVYLTKDILILQEPCGDGCSSLFTRLR